MRADIHTKSRAVAKSRTTESIICHTGTPNGRRTIITTGVLGAGFLPGLIAVAAMVAVVVYLCINATRKMNAEYALKAQAVHRYALQEQMTL